ncbi:MAG: hypothetical protein Ta2B_11400 [Termitinemataceae bacterium]|nr:MAG: hypothetical protein Ta2B_11400 [Termitinemataceae bacterium]
MCLISNVGKCLSTRTLAVIGVVLITLAAACNTPDGSGLDGGGSSAKQSGLYTVIFDPTGGNFDGSSEVREVKTDSNNRVKVPAEPTRKDFCFAGWHLEEKFDSPEFTNATVVSANMRVYAVWSGEVKKVSFYVRDAGGIYVEHLSKYLSHPKDTVDSLPEQPTRDDGFVFQGWYTKQQENILVTNTELVASGEADVVFSRDVPTTDKFELGKTKVNSDINVYGLWQERPKNSIMVTFKPYPGNVVQNSFALSFHEYKLPHTARFPLTVTRPYYTLLEGGKWFKADDSTVFTKNSAEGASDGTQLTKEGTGTEDDIVVHQKWSFNGYNITFNSHFGTNPPPIKVKVDGEAIGTLPTPDERTGYMFKGWFSQTSGGGTHIKEATVPECDIDAHALWEQITITFDSQLGDIGGIMADPQSLSVDSTGKLSSLPTKPKKGGHAFMGWYPNVDGTGIKLESTAEISTSAVYYAKWFTPAEITTANAAASNTTNGTEEHSYVATTDGVDEVHVFKTTANDTTLTSTLTVNRAPADSSVKVFIVAGGGGGGMSEAVGYAAFGGGSGGVILDDAVTLTESVYTVTVGSGGNGGSISGPTDSIEAKINAVKTNANGADSSIVGNGLTGLTAKGGGGGGWCFAANASGGGEGGSGGGGLGTGFGDGGSGTTGQGNNGHTGENASGGGYSSVGTEVGGGAGLDNPWPDIANGVPSITVPDGFAGGGSSGNAAGTATHGGGYAVDGKRDGTAHSGGGGCGGLDGNGYPGGSGIVMVRWHYIGD